MPKPKKDEPKLNMSINIEPEQTADQDNNTIDLATLSKRELVKIAKKLAIKGYGSLLKDKLIQQIKIVEEKERLNQIINSEKIQALTKIELIEMAKNLSIKNISKMNKDDLIKNIREKSNNMENNEELDEKGFTIESQEVTQEIESKEPIETESNSIYTKEYLTALNMQEIIAIAKKISIKSYYKYNKTRLINKIVDELKKQEDETENIEQQEIKEPVSKTEVKENLIDNNANEILELQIDLNIENNDIEKSLIVDKPRKLVKVKPLETNKIKEDKKEEFTQLSIEEEIEKLNKKESLETIAVPIVDKIEVTAENKLEPVIDKIETPTETTVAPIVDKIEVTTENKLETVIEKVKTEEEILAEIKLKELKDFLYKPSKFNFGTPNEAFLFEDEKDIKLGKLPINIDKVVLLPVDPTQVFVYWELTEKLLDRIKAEKITDFILKVNNVTGILYDGKNEIESFIEKVSTKENNYYINLSEGNKNLCVELCFFKNNVLHVISKSNTIYVPRNRASQLVLDTFVVVNLPKYQTKIKELRHEPTIKRLNIQRNLTTNNNYYNLNDYKIAENYNLRRMVNKMPVLDVFSEIPAPFNKDFEIQVTNDTNFEKVQTNFVNELKLPERHTDVAIPEFNEDKTFESLDVLNIDENKLDLIQKDFSFYDESINHKEYNGEVPAENYSEYVKAEPIIEQKSEEKYYFRETQFMPENDNMEFIRNFYYTIPTDSKQVHYEWVENGIPYKKIIYWVYNSEPQIHEKIYKLSYGPSWVREFVGGSEQIRYLGASERFLGASEQFLGASEFSVTFVGSSGLFTDNNRFLGSSDAFLGSSELVAIGSSGKHLENKLIARNYHIRKLFE